MNRRTALKGAGGLGLAGALAACGGGGSGAAPASPGPAANGPLTDLASIKVGSSKVVEKNGAKVAISRTGEDTVVAFSAVCTHQGCTVKARGAELDCPCHGSKFNATTGAVLHGPADAPLPSVAVRVENGQVVAG